MRFRYPLQKIVDLKENERTQAEWLLSEALTELKSEEKQLKELLASKKELGQSLTEASLNCAKISELMVFQHYLTFVDQQIVLQDKEVKHAQEHVVHRKDELTHKMMDQKIWDKAKEKAQNIYHANALKKEQEQLDDIVTLRYNTL